MPFPDSKNCAHSSERTRFVSHFQLMQDMSKLQRETGNFIDLRLHCSTKSDNYVIKSNASPFAPAFSCLKQDQKAAFGIFIHLPRNIQIAGSGSRSRLEVLTTPRSVPASALSGRVPTYYSPH